MYEIKKDNNRFYIEESELVGEIKFNVEGNNLIVTKTYVNPNYRGKSIARILVDKVVEMARLDKMMIVSVCSYVHHTFEKNEEYSDVWNKEYKYENACEI